MSKTEYDPDALLRGLSEVLRNRRKELKISQEDLSYDAGFARGYLSDIERGSRSFSIKNLTRLANALSMPVSALVRLAENKVQAESDEKELATELISIVTLLCSKSRGLLLTDPSLSDNPIVFASEGFSDYTGYSKEETMGRNCRYLQRGDRTQPEIDLMRDAVVRGEFLSVVLRNYRKDGSVFLNSITLNPLRNEAGRLTCFLGLQRKASAPEVAAYEAAHGQRSE